MARNERTISMVMQSGIFLAQDSSNPRISGFSVSRLDKRPRKLAAVRSLLIVIKGCWIYHRLYSGSG